MTVADAASLRTVAVQLRSLSADSDNQPIIAREEGCMRALSSFVSGTDIDTATIAVAALKNLVSHPDNYEVMRSEEALLEGLKDLLLAETAERDLRKDIFYILEELTDEKDDDEMDELDDLEKSAGLKEKASVVLDDDAGLLKEPVTARLRVQGISDEIICVRIEQLLIRKRGVISVVFEIGAETAVVYTRLPPGELASFVATMTGSQVQVLPDAPSDEELEAKSEELDDNADNEKENDGRQPGYLDQTGQRFRDVAKKNAKKKNTISQGASSLSERLRVQREEERRKKARTNRLMNSIGRGFSSGWGLW